MPLGVIVPLIVFGFIAIIVKMSLDHAKWKRTHTDAGGAERSLTTSELHRIIDESVRDATRGLEERLERLEAESGPSIEDNVSGQIYETGGVRQSDRTRT